MSADPVSAAQLHAWAALPPCAPAFSPLEGPRSLLLALDDVDLRGDEAAQAAAWLRALPVPSIGVGAGDGALATACDVVVESAEAAAPLINAIERNPIAAAVFVRLLRGTEPLAIEDALVAESLAYSTLQAGPEYAR
ncbi:MAG: enoyl-CoA hydratase/isomerase family protein, partial [Gammaproteobacteria bacterium]